MKALTVRAPFGTLIAMGAERRGLGLRLQKRIENRTWEPTPNELRPGEVFAVHQGVKYDRARVEVLQRKVPELMIPTEAELEETQGLGAFVCLAWFGGVLLSAADLGKLPDLGQFPFWEGPLAWWLREVRAVRPLAAKGREKLWNMSTEQQAELLARAGLGEAR